MSLLNTTSIRPRGSEPLKLYVVFGFLVTVFASNSKDDDVDPPMLPFPLPRRTPGFVFNGGKSNAAIHLSAFLDLTCADSKRVWPMIKKLANKYGPTKIRLTVHFFALAYFDNAFRALKSVFTVAAYNSSLLFPWVDDVFKNQDQLKNSARTWTMSPEDIFKMKTCVIQIARVITQMAKRTGILSRVMSDGLRSHDIESEARMAWKFACSKAVMGTPTFFLNDVFIGVDASSNWGEKQWNGMIDKILT
ncbi:unnamed protein product [Pocillopora meandrina]|uniref:Thioredoxin-like fold domain-containing protein n=1 Tax=Pocillopora meandrina TaxID=46732 RepID=A0AAU9XRM7_9CNID|nr:unnamed protein product [Pocillopora meandrina]